MDGALSEQPAALDPDAELVSRARLGDEDAFGELIERHQRLLTGLAYGMTHDEARSEDLVQDAFVSAWRALPKFRGAARFRNWLCRILYNKVRSAMRWSALRRFVRLESSADEAGRSWAEALADPSLEGDPQGGALRAETDAAIRGAIAALPFRQRSVVLMRANGLGLREIADAMGVAEGTVKAHLHHARQKLEPFAGEP
jgi:RNA polymerase sigma-70 factor (ECF subfamily)